MTARRRGWVTTATVAAVVALAPAAFAQPQPPPPPDQPGGPYGGPPPPPPDAARPPPPDDYPPQPQPPPPAAFERRGWFAGFHLGLGSLTVNDGDRSESFGGLAIGGHFGGMLSPRFALLVELDAGAHADSERDAGYGLANWGLAAQLWGTDRFWFRGGFGTTNLNLTIGGDQVDSASGRSLTLAAGYELSRRQSFVLDAHLRMVLTSYKDTPDDCCSSNATSLNVGFAWY